MENLFIKLAVKLLDKDDGISEAAYAALLEMGEKIRPQLCLDLNNAVSACEGRFFLKLDWHDALPDYWKMGEDI